MALSDSKDAIGLALAKIPSGASIVTAAHDGRTCAMLASWIQQVSFEPPMVCLAVKHGRAVEPVIDGSKRFVVNVVGENDKGILKQFSKGPGSGGDPLAALATESCSSGPILSDCIAKLACEVTAKHEAGDHHLYLARVATAAADKSAKPHIHVRSSGMSY